MPGIVGVVSPLPPEQMRQDLGQMLRCLKHEPFYHSGIYVNEQLGLYTGRVCHENAFADCMPVFNEKKDLLLIFSGENFADCEAIRHLRTQGHDFGDSKASYLIHLYESDEKHFFQSLNGWFSGILVDLRKKQFILFNDRYGFGRIYYHENKDTFLFASEAKALLRVCPGLRGLDLDALGQYLVCGTVLQHRTLFPRVFLLPGGSAWEFRQAKCSGKNYYFKSSFWESQPTLEWKLFYPKLRETLTRIIPRYLRSTRSVGMSLTGGLDTRTMMACLDFDSREIPCYTFGGIYRDTADMRIAREVASACHQQYYPLRISPDFFSSFSQLAEKTIFVTDGYHDVCGSHEIYFNRLAREIAPIRVTGKFGSEILRSQRLLAPIRLAEDLFHADFRPYIKQGYATLQQSFDGHDLSDTVFKSLPWERYGRLAAEQSQLTIRTPFMDNEVVALMYQAPPETRVSNKAQLQFIADLNPVLQKILTNRGGLGNNTLLTKCIQLFNRATLQAEYAYLYQLPSWAQKLFSVIPPAHVERLFLGRHKFEHYSVWFRRQLATYMQDILLSQRANANNAPYWNKGFIEKMIYSHVSGSKNYVNEINKVITLELMRKLLIDSSNFNS